MNVIKAFLPSLLIPFTVVSATSLPFYVIIRLYPVILDFENQGFWANYKFSLFYFSLCFGSLLAVLLCDFKIGPFFTPLAVITVQCLLLVVTLTSEKLPEITLLILMNGLGLTLGMLQTLITAFFGDQYNTGIGYSYLTHFHFYLLANYIAYFCSILFIPMKNYKRIYAECFDQECHIFPIVLSMICLGGSAAIIILIYRQGFSQQITEIKLTAVYRMGKAFYIFLPLSVFWMLTFLMEQLWIGQAKNMRTILQDYSLDLIHAAILIGCIPFAWLCSLKGNELLRMTLGGILIICSVPLSSLFGTFYVPRARDAIAPRYNITEIYTNNTDNVIEVHICDLYHSTTENYYQIDSVNFFGTNQRCMGPLIINETILFNKTYYKWNTTGKRSQLKLTPYFPQTGVTTLIVRPLVGGLDTQEFIAVPDRNYRSVAKLAFLRIFSCLNENTTSGTWNVTGINNTDIQIVMMLSTMFIMELPEGYYNVSYLIISKLLNKTDSSLYYLRSGGYYIVMINQGINAEKNGTNKKPMKIAFDCRIPGFVRSIHDQWLQYILLSFGKILILTSGVEVCYALADVGMKCTLVGVFWGLYYFADIIYYLMIDFLMDHAWGGIRPIYMIMSTAIVTFYTLYYFKAYDLTDVVKQFE